MNIVYSLKSPSQDATANLKAEYGSKVISPERSIRDVREKLLQTVDCIPQEKYFMGEYFYKMLVQNVSHSERGKKLGIKENEYIFSFYKVLNNSKSRIYYDEMDSGDMYVIFEEHTKCIDCNSFRLFLEIQLAIGVDEQDIASGSILYQAYLGNLKNYHDYYGDSQPILKL